MAILQEHAHGTPAFPVASYPFDYHPGTDFAYFPHYHDELEFFQIYSGSAIVWVNTLPYRMYAGDALIIPSSAIHSCKVMEASVCRTYAFLCHPDFLYGRNNDVIFAEYLRQLMTPDATALRLRVNTPTASRVNHLFREISSMFDSPQPCYELLIKSYLLELLYLGFTTMDTQESQLLVDPAVSIIRKSLDFIQAHLSEDISLGTLAEQCCLSPTQYGRLFRRVMDCTPITYLLEKRISYARQLLSSSEMKISDIAAECGFNNFSYFNRCFRKYQGVTPSEYRLNNKHT